MRASLQKLLESIGANVCDLRRRADQTQEQLAEAVDVDITYLQRIERGKTNLSFDIFIALAYALGVAPERLTREAAMPPPGCGRPPKRTSRESGDGPAADGGAAPTTAA